jgi:CO/xanthine dehydrogenase FAD-binding subunit
MHQTQYLRPTSLDEALLALADRRFEVLAGGTDFYPARVGKPVDVDILDITRVSSLRGIRDEGRLFRIGAATTWSDLIAAPVSAPFDAQFAGLRAAARDIGGLQIQNAGTVAGNLCNASPAADGVPPLLALGTRVELASSKRTRSVALADFVLGNRKTARQPDELVTAVLVPKWRAGSRGVFLKLGHRRYLVISIAMVSAVAALDDTGRVALCGIAVGACSAVAQRLPRLEARLIGRPAREAASLVAAEDLNDLTPIDDVRGSAAYRIDAVLTLVRQAVAQAVDGGPVR